MKLRKLRALRGGGGVGQQQPQQQQQQGVNGNKNTVLADLESIRGLFNEKEKELAMAVTKAMLPVGHQSVHSDSYIYNVFTTVFWVRRRQFL